MRDARLDGRILARSKEKVMADPVPRFELYDDKNTPGEYRWRLIGGNGSDILADSGEGYSSKAGAKEGIADVKRHAGPAPIVEK